MAVPFRAQFKSFTFKGLVEYFRSVTGAFPDTRTGDNARYSMKDAALGAFSLFFTQSPSFLDFQRTMQLTKGCSNAQSLFGMTQFPSDAHTRKESRRGIKGSEYLKGQRSEYGAYSCVSTVLESER